MVLRKLFKLLRFCWIFNIKMEYELLRFLGLMLFIWFFIDRGEESGRVRYWRFIRRVWGYGIR